jgi:hypothetical protein
MGLLGGIERGDSDRRDGLFSDIETIGSLTLLFNKYSKDIGALPHFNPKGAVVSIDIERFGQFEYSRLEHFKFIIGNRDIEGPVVDFSFEL